jgi:glycosyltransferase involved in cell wall biosynthesis
MGRFLLVTKEYSETPTSGGSQRTLAIAETLSQYGDVVVVSPQATLRREQGFVVPVAALPPADLAPWRLVVAYRSISGARAGGPGLLRNLERAVQQQYDLAVVDHTCLAGVADIVGRHARRVVVSMHNIESTLMADRARAARSRREGLGMRVEARLLSRLERVVAARRHPTIVVSDADAAALPNDPPPVVCRNGVFPSRIVRPERPLPSRALIFTGALDWEPNVHGIEWFLLTTWPRVRALFPDATLTIAGRNPSSRLLQHGRMLPGVTVVADPPDMQPLLAAHGVGIVPLLEGGGSRLKILEYLAAGLDVVSTDAGASGLEDVPSELMDRAPKADFFEALTSRLRNPRDNRDLATEWVRCTYTWDITMEPLAKLLADA